MVKECENIMLKNNKLIFSRYNVTALYNKLFQLMFHRMQNTNYEEGLSTYSSDDKTIAYRIKLQEIKDLITNKSNKTKNGIHELLENMSSVRVRIKTDNEYHNYGLINGFSFYEDTQEFIIRSQKIVFDLMHHYLTTGFTPVNMKVYLSFNGFYTQRLYELIRQWSNAKDIIEYTTEELRSLLMLEDKYARQDDFKKKVITPAINELNKSECMEVVLDEVKEGRKVVAYKFKVNDNDDRNMEKVKQLSHDKKMAKQKEILEKAQSKKNKALKATEDTVVDIDAPVVVEDIKPKRSYNKNYSNNNYKTNYSNQYRRNDGSMFRETCPTIERSEEEWHSLERQLLGWE